MDNILTTWGATNKYTNTNSTSSVAAPIDAVLLEPCPTDHFDAGNRIEQNDATTSKQQPTVADGGGCIRLFPLLPSSIFLSKLGQSIQ